MERTDLHPASSFAKLVSIFKDVSLKLLGSLDCVLISIYAVILLLNLAWSESKDIMKL